MAASNYPGDHAEAGFEARAAVAIDAGEGPQWGMERTRSRVVNMTKLP